MPRISRSNNAFTLLEALVTMALLVAVFGVLSELLRGSYRVLQEQSYKNQGTQAVQLALNRMCCEARECCNITTAGLNTLSLQIVDPNYLNSPTGPGYNPADPYDSGNLDQVVYTLQPNGVLQRTITPAPATGLATVTQNLVTDLVGMNCVYTAPDGSTTPSTLNITLSVADLNLGIRSMSTQVYPMALYP